MEHGFARMEKGWRYFTGIKNVAQNLELNFYTVDSDECSIVGSKSKLL